MEIDEVLAADKKIIADLTYRSYECQRMLAPEVSVERWEKVFGPSVWSMEERLQLERMTVGQIFICQSAGEA